MKTANEHIDYWVRNRINLTQCIERAQKDAYNQAIDDAANTATLKEKTTCKFTDFCGSFVIKETIVDKDSILKLKIK